MAGIHPYSATWKLDILGSPSVADGERYLSHPKMDRIAHPAG